MRRLNRTRKKPGFWRTVRSALLHAVPLLFIAGAYLFVVLDGLAPTPARGAQPQDGETAAHAAPTWALDLDGDGVPDVANPTHKGVRGKDRYGSGAFGAERDNGRRKHEGADFIAAPGDAVYAPLSGVITKMGFAYPNDLKLRFVELSDAPMHLMARIFYVDPSIAVGQGVTAGEVIGAAQSLARRYPLGITNHVHVEISDGRGFMFDPVQILTQTTKAPILAALKQDPRLSRGTTARG